ncbi:hypothetical protein GLYMA_05G071950v4 [Glycine max]|nr:hypothetical protein GLYMA_05G071950v4 [Glycine max]KAH1133196.1 hypothetical protein GYH30_011859 [Glycine max]
MWKNWLKLKLNWIKIGRLAMELQKIAIRMMMPQKSINDHFYLCFFFSYLFTSIFYHLFW